MNVCTFGGVGGWRHELRSMKLAPHIACRKLKVSFTKRATNFRAMLRKMTYKDRASYDSTPPLAKRIAREDANLIDYMKTNTRTRTHTHTHTHTHAHTQAVIHPIAFGVSCTHTSCDTPYCIWSVMHTHKRMYQEEMTSRHALNHPFFDP